MTIEEAKALTFFLMDKNIHAWPQLSSLREYIGRGRMLHTKKK